MLKKTSFIILLFVLSGCMTAKTQEIKDQALTGGFKPKLIHTDRFDIYMLSRMSNPGPEANIYIEGDGYAWASRNMPSSNPTPKYPLALDLATRDNADNVIYMARPCQYVGPEHRRNCDVRYWTSHRFASEVIDSYDLALDTLKEKYNIRDFHLIGYSGGANIAALLTHIRDDVVSLRTVAGNMDHKLLHEIHAVSQIPESLNAVNIAPKISKIPQKHFTGQRDKIVPEDIALSFARASGERQCVSIVKVASAGHHKGWAESWSDLLSSRPECDNQTMH